MDIPNELVGINVRSNLQEETLIRGRDILEGDIVLVAEPIYRTDPKYLEMESPSDHDLYRLASTSRWCRVTKVERHNQVISFVGLYHDQSEYPRSYNESIFWFCKNVA